MSNKKNNGSNVVQLHTPSVEESEGFEVYRIPMANQEGMRTELLVLQHTDHRHPTDIVMSLVQEDAETGEKESVAFRACNFEEVMDEFINVIEHLVKQYNESIGGTNSVQ